MTYEDRQRVIGLRDHRTAPAETQERKVFAVTTPPAAAPAPALAPAAAGNNRQNPALDRGNQLGTRPATP